MMQNCVNNNLNHDAGIFIYFNVIHIPFPKNKKTPISIINLDAHMHIKITCVFTFYKEDLSK